MALQSRRRRSASLVAICWGLASPIIAEAIIAERLGLEGPPVLYGSLGLVVVGAAVALWRASAYSVKEFLLYGVLALGGGAATFVYLFTQTQA